MITEDLPKIEKTLRSCFWNNSLVETKQKLKETKVKVILF